MKLWLKFWMPDMIRSVESALVTGFHLLRILLFLGAVALLVYAIVSHFLDSI